MELNPQIHRVTIESLAYGGHGLTHIDGKVCFIPYGLPGDELLIELEGKKHGVEWAKSLDVCTPSPHRWDPICPKFEECGGCQWLHMDFSEQIKWKMNMVESALARIGKVKSPVIESYCEGIFQLGYRTRAKFHFDKKDGYLRFGFLESKSSEVADIKICPLLYGGMNDLLPYIRHILENTEYLKRPGSVEITINPINNESLIWLELARRDRDLIGQTALRMSEIEGVIDADYAENYLEASALNIALGEIKAWIPSGIFSQSSFINNEPLLHLVHHLAGDVKGKNVFDIYSGWGNLSLGLALKGAIVTGYDSDPISVDAANLSASDNRLENTEYFEAIDSSIPKILKDKENIDLIILDPPRTGAKAVADAVAQSSAERIIYVSCDPNTFARDFKMMSEHGRKLVKTYVIDMIPQTYHIETVNVIE
jgi:23S rRNA (uracil1939-C5)-methyltransferase